MPAASSSRVSRPEITLRPIWPNAGIEAWYRATLQELIRRMARSMILHVRAAYRSAPSIGFASDSVSTIDDAMKKWGRQWIANFEAASAEIATAFATRSRDYADNVFKERLKAAGFVIHFRPTDGMREAYKATIAEQVNLIKSIPQEFLKDVQSSVWQSVMKGSALGELSRTIKHKYEISWKRAALIARDQNAKAKAIMEEQRREDLGIVEAEWMHSHAGKEPRPTHVAMNGKRYKIKQGMWDEAVQRYVWPGTEINCRCSSRAIIPGLD